MPQTKIFHVRKTADKDLENIFIYRVEEFGIKRAEKYIDDLVLAFHSPQVCRRLFSLSQIVCCIS